MLIDKGIVPILVGKWHAQKHAMFVKYDEIDENRAR